MWSLAFLNLRGIMESGLSKINPYTFFIYQITNRPIQGIWNKEPFPVMNFPQNRKYCPLNTRCGLVCEAAFTKTFPVQVRAHTWSREECPPAWQCMMDLWTLHLALSIWVTTSLHLKNNSPGSSMLGSLAFGNCALSWSCKKSIPGTHIWEVLWLVRFIWMEIERRTPGSQCSTMKKFSLVFIRLWNRASVQTFGAIGLAHLSVLIRLSLFSQLCSGWHCAQACNGVSTAAGLQVALRVTWLLWREKANLANMSRH